MKRQMAHEKKSANRANDDAGFDTRASGSAASSAGEYQVTVERLANGGDGVGHLPDGRCVFVRCSCPGDIARVAIDEDKPRYARGHIVEVLEPGPSRVAPPCPYHDLCGGCPWQAIGYDAQLAGKRQLVVDALARLGHVDDAESLVGAIVPSEMQWGYRNKVEWGVRTDGQRLSVGFHRPASDDVIAVDRCLLLPKGYEKAPKSITGALRYVGRPEHGLSSVCMRVSARTRSSEISLWGAPGAIPRHAYAEVLGDAIKPSSVTHVLVRTHRGRTSADKVEVLDGAGFWHERLDGRGYRISSPSFFQVNTAGAEKLVELVVEGLSPTDSERICDLYCGAGTFTLPLAARAGEVIAVEEVGSSLRDLKRNLEGAQLDADIRPGDVARAMDGNIVCDALVVDPPRNGMSPDAIRGTVSTHATRIAYVSCNPTTLARDLQEFSKAGYHIEQVTPVDLFPQTYHVETVTILSL